MTALETGLIITSVLFCAATWLACYYKEKAIKAERDLSLCRNSRECLNEKLSKSETSIDYLKSMNAKFIKLNNKLLDQMDEMVDKRKFNGTKHKKR